MYVNDISIATRQYCDACKRVTDHFGLATPESEILFYECIKCGSIREPLENVSFPTWARRAIVAVALTGLAGIVAYKLVGHREKQDDQKKDEEFLEITAR
jgi:hypothetical protein